MEIPRNFHYMNFIKKMVQPHLRIRPTLSPALLSLSFILSQSRDIFTDFSIAPLFLVNVPSVRVYTYVDHAFSCSGASLCNRLPKYLWDSPLSPDFRRYLKTFLFARYHFLRRCSAIGTLWLLRSTSYYYYHYYYFNQGKTLGGLKIAERRTNCLEVYRYPTLAGRHQQNHHAAKPN